MIKINSKKDNTYGNTMYEFISDDSVMKWFTNRCGDLYWALFTRKNNPDDEYSFEIGIQNYKLYAIIEGIYEDFKNGNIFYDSELDSELKYNAVILNRNQYIRTITREVYNGMSEELIWDSDEDSKDYTNCIKILKGENKFTIKFYDIVHGNLIRVCFKKNRGYYGPCSLPFFRAFNAIDKIKDDYNTSFDEYFNVANPKLEETDAKPKTYLKTPDN